MFSALTITLAVYVVLCWIVMVLVMFNELGRIRQDFVDSGFVTPCKAALAGVITILLGPFWLPLSMFGLFDQCLPEDD